MCLRPPCLDVLLHPCTVSGREPHNAMVAAQSFSTLQQGLGELVTELLAPFGESNISSGAQALMIHSAKSNDCNQLKRMYALA